MLIIKDLTYKLQNNTKIFNELSFIIKDNEKIALLGKNGIGKSTLLKLIMDDTKEYNSKIIKNNLNIGYFQQKFNELDFRTVADVFNLEKQIIALNNIEKYNANIEDYGNIDNFWNCRDIIDKKFQLFNLKFDYLQKYNTLSGGEKVKLILSSIINKDTNFLILDEPTNNMDYDSKIFFFNFLKNWQHGVLLVSHDRELLNLVDKIYELRKLETNETKLFIYGGNFEYFLQQKQIEKISIEKKYDNSIKNIKKQKEQIIKNEKNYQKNIKTGKKSLKNKKIDKMKADYDKNIAEKQHGDLIKRDEKELEKINNNIMEIKETIEKKENIYFKFKQTENLPNKIILKIQNLYFSYNDKQILKNINLIVKTQDRIAINGKNGSGKTTLLKIITNEIKTCTGIINCKLEKIVYINQDQDILDNNKSIIENMINYTNLSELNCRNILAQFLFRTDTVYKKISDLSGGEKIRVNLACVLNKSDVELIILDEPTNNLDLESIEVLENIINNFNGAIIVVSHDNVFKKNINISSSIEL